MTQTSPAIRPLETRRRRKHRLGTPALLFMSIPGPIDTLTSGLASICRIPRGVTVEADVVARVAVGQRPQLKVLYDVENNCACRLVRERITELDLVVDKVVPAAPNSRVFKDASDPYALPVGTAVPRLIATTSDDEERTLSGSDAIVEFLDRQFAAGVSAIDEEPIDVALRALRQAGGSLAAFLRIGRGAEVSAAADSSGPRPSRPLVLYSYEGNQFCRLVREVLTELDLAYELRSAGKESPRRDELAELTGGSSQCPYLVDPNTERSMPESADIVQYLYTTYAQWTPPNELLQWASDVILPLAKPLFKVLAPLQAGSSGEDSAKYQQELAATTEEINKITKEHSVVVYTYSLSPFSTETKALLERLEIDYKEVSLGAEWIPGLIAPGGAQTRAALLDMTGQSSLPHIFVGGTSIGGLFSGTPGLLPALEQGVLREMVASAAAASSDKSLPATVGDFE